MSFHFSGSGPRTVRVDLMKDEIDGLKLGSEVTLTVLGSIKILEAPYEPTKEQIKDGAKKNPPGEMVLKVSKVTVEEAGNEFTEMTKDEEKS